MRQKNIVFASKILTMTMSFWYAPSIYFPARAKGNYDVQNHMRLSSVQQPCNHGPVRDHRRAGTKLLTAEAADAFFAVYLGTVSAHFNGLRLAYFLAFPAADT